LRRKQNGGSRRREQAGLGNVEKSQNRSEIYAAVAVLAVTAAIIGIIGVQSIWTFNAKVAEIRLASQRAVTGERINGLILAVVMDSRGVYMSANAEAAEKFAKPLMANLQQLDQFMAEWRAQMPESRRHEFDTAAASTRKFIEFRSELVRLGREVSTAKAREWGDNEANRSVRKQLNDDIKALADVNNQEIAA
jgi:methyl-accepting chemotaxis protein